MDDKNSNNPALDVLGFLDQTIDTVLDNEIIKHCKETGDVTGTSIVALCMEYGIHGRKLFEFIQKLGMICDLTKGDKKEGQDDG